VILNAYAVLDAFVAFLRLAAGIAIVGVAVSAWCKRSVWSRAPGADAASSGKESLESRYYLLVLLGILLFGINLASWPLLYLLLQSYIPEWPGVMCIYGVTQVGAGSEGTSRYLPGILKVLQITKPLLVFGSGVWLVLYLANRRTQTGPLTSCILLVAIALGSLAVGDAVAEGAYLLIPKKEEWLSTGCCSVATEGIRTIYSEPVFGLRDRAWLSVAYYAINVGLIVALVGYGFRASLRQKLPALAPLLVGALVALPISAIFLTEAAAPILLHLPYHHCAYDLIPDVPEMTLGIALFIVGTFAVGWACALSWLGRCEATASFLDDLIGKILFVGFWCYLGSLAMTSVELALAK
jgi:hypothetical protein